MENMRQKIDLTPQAVSFSLKPSKGVVGEDLGRTQFTSGPNRRVLKASNLSKRPDNEDSSESDDDLNAFSEKHQTSSFAIPIQKYDVSKKRETSRKMGPLSISSSRPKGQRDVKIDEKNNSPKSAKRPEPRPAFKAVKSFESEKEIPFLSQRALKSKQSRKASVHEESYCTSRGSRGKRLKVSKVGPCHLDPAPFPLEVEHNAASQRTTALSPRKPTPFPLDVPDYKRLQSTPSPQSYSPKGLVFQTAPVDDPSVSSHGCNSYDSDDDLKMTENDTILTYGGPRPFPMSMSQFPLDPVGDNAVPEQCPHNKKDREACMNPFSIVSNEIGETSLNGNDEVDPSMICPYCDEPWPSTPSPTLISLLERTKRKSYADPRHGNALGLKAPLAAFVELCQRHRFEMTHLPLALKRGWPTRLDFTNLPKRVGTFRKELKKIFDQPDESQFWRELLETAKRVGMKKVVSVSGQYATFERTQPGYYGEQGSIIIHQSLYTLFPPDSILAASVFPLTSDQFLTRVLVPETAVLLIQQDLCLKTKEEALEVLEESKQYGVAMFPEQAQDDEVAEIGEKLARDRARARRKMLEERGEADEDVRREVEREQHEARRAKVKSKGSLKADWKGKTKVSDTNPETDQQTNNKTSVGGSRNVTPQTRQECDDIQIVDAYEEPTPRPAKVNKGIQEPMSWRPNRSPSTSPEPRKTNKSLRNRTRKSSSLSQFTTCEGKWSFELHNDRAPSSPESMIHEVCIDRVIAASQHQSTKHMDGSVSDVLVITDDEALTPPLPKMRGTIKGVSTHILRDKENGTDMISHAQPRLNPSNKMQNGSGKGQVALGQTKRRRKGKEDRSMSDGRDFHSWLLSDPSELE